jgi:hypothetical protein
MFPIVALSFVIENSIVVTTSGCGKKAALGYQYGVKFVLSGLLVSAAAANVVDMN